VALVADLAESPTTSVRLLAENLVLFRDQRGAVGLLAERCAHDGAMLIYGWVERRGLVCPLHRWQFDAAGNCFIVPGAPPGIPPHPTIRQTAYPVAEAMGMYWAYLGPMPAPAVPWETWVQDQSQARPRRLARRDANWMQSIESSVGSGGMRSDVLNLVQRGSMLEFHVPIDDTHTQVFVLDFG
jgi:phenylpropionate dioxygenase-like ring-hydroxylating dioxygenase large terminal subunit